MKNAILQARTSSVWTISRFGHQKGPLVFRGLERSLGLENLAYIAEVKNSNNLGGSVGEAPWEIFVNKFNIFLSRKGKNVAHSDEIHREKTLLNAQKEIFSLGKKIVLR